MRIKALVFLLISISIASCDLSNNKPDDLIPKEKMAHILKDLMLLEATYNTKLVRLENKNELMRKFSDEILEHYNVKKEVFDRSYEYYQMNSDEFEAVYELVFEELTKMETEAIAVAAETVNDSTAVE